MQKEKDNKSHGRKKKLSIFLLSGTGILITAFIVFNVYAVYARPNCGPFPEMTATHTHNFWYDLLNISPSKGCKEDTK